MKIIEANIIQFGKFKDRVFTFDDGLNIVKGDNESGKSTLLGFIKFVLYGVGRKNPSIAVGERERAISWNAGIAAGSLTLEDTDGRRYRIERSGREGARGSYSDKVRIIDLENGNEVFEGEIPGEHFLGINAQGYDSMCNIKQLEATLIGGDAVKGAIDNLLSSGDEAMSVQGAIKMLDAERRRLLHTNGRGGLVYEGELALQRLKNDYKSALSFENECVKNIDELESVELSLAKARDEHQLAQRMCDAHDDVIRLEKFDRLRELKGEGDSIKAELDALKCDAGFDTSLADFAFCARIRSVAESFGRAHLAQNEAKRELDAAQRAFDLASGTEQVAFAELIEEFGSPTSAITHLRAKKVKKRNALITLAVFGLAAAALIAFAVLLVTGGNISGAATVGFIGIILGAVAFSSYKKMSGASAEIRSLLNRAGKDFADGDEAKLFNALEKFYNGMNERSRLSNARESAAVRLGLLEDAYIAELGAARSIADSLGIACSDEALLGELMGASEKMSEYLEKRAALEKRASENGALIGALSRELERFSESDIRSRLDPSVIEKIKSISFEKLKSERDSALFRTNQLSQYKAGIERNLASSERRTPSSEIFPEIEAAEERLETLKLRLDAVRLAADTINISSAELKSDVTPRIRERAQANLSLMSEGKYNELFIDENMGLSIFAEGATRPIDSLSKGSLDIAYFSVRLALLQTLLAEKAPPLYMDETLSQLDDNRAKSTLRAIAEHARRAQCILFTCQNRDVELAKDITAINLIEI